MATTIEELEKRREAAKLGGGEKRIAAQHAKGRLTARERLSVLLDEGNQRLHVSGSVSRAWPPGRSARFSRADDCGRSHVDAPPARTRHISCLATDWE